jgi:hypothetical protein
MSALETSRGEKTHCRELNSGKCHSGFFFIDDQNIHADIYAFDERFYVPTNGPVYLQTANNEFVTLHDNISGPPGTNSSGIEPRRVVYHQHIISNVAVIGPDRWAEEDLIKSVTFKVDHSEVVFRNKDKTENLFKGKIGDKLDHDLFSVRIGGMVFRCAYGASFSIGRDHPKEVWPYLEIEFDEGVTLAGYLFHVESVVQLLSSTLGARLKPSQIAISRLSGMELLASTVQQRYFGHHSVNYVWAVNEIEKSNIWVGKSFLSAWTDSDLAALEQCLRVWLERLPTWKDANALMIGSLSMRGEISPNRLMGACRWFEEIPTTKTKQVIADKDINAISRQASEKAVQLGYGEIKNRVAGSLKAISTETHDDRFRRLLDGVRMTFGESIIDQKCLQYCKQAMEFRGKTAHGHFNPDGADEFRLLAKSIYALEALCFLLTIQDLPIGGAGIERARRSQFLQDYNYCL